MTLAKLTDLRKLHFLHLQHRGNSRTILSEVLWELNKIIQGKCLALCRSKNASLSVIINNKIIHVIFMSSIFFFFFVKQWFL